MEQETKLNVFLSGIRDDVYKLLPMKEESLTGKENFIDRYLETLLVNLLGAEDVYIGISTNKQYLYVVNNIAYLSKNLKTNFKAWRRIVLNCTRLLGEICESLKSESEEG